MTDQVQIVNARVPYVTGLAVSRASNTTLTVASGACSDSNGTIDMVLPASVTINAAVKGINGIDAGTFAASSLYAVYLVSDVTNTKVPGAIMSLSATAPTLPSGYNTFRRIGWAVSDGSTHFVILTQYGNGGLRKYRYDAPVSALSGGTSSSYAAVDLTNIVPAVAANVIFNAVITPTAAGNSATVRPSGSASTTYCPINGAVAAVAQDLQITVPCTLVTGAPKVDYIVTGSLSLSVAGFEDYL